MSYPESLLWKYRTKGAIIDTNLLLLWVTGTFSWEQIEKSNRLRKFVPSDFELITRLVSSFDRIVATPNIVTELDNLSRQIGEWAFAGVSTVLASFLNRSLEVYISSRECSSLQNYPKMGITDAGLLIASKDYLVITDDFPLSGRLADLGRDVLNFHHVRGLI
jgi:hypothetical protein